MAEAAELAKSRPSALSNDVIRNCEDELNALERDLQKRTNRFAWPFQEKELKKHIEALGRFRQIFSDYVSSVTLNSSVVSYEKLQQVALPGVGKSVLASIAIDDLRRFQAKAAPTVAYYLCDFSSRERHDPLAILQALLRQTVEQAGEDVVSQIKDAVADPHSRTDEAELCKILGQACALHPTYLVIDAPDELDKPGRILAHLLRLAECKARILITSREMSEMKKFSNTVKLRAESDIEDIRKYLTAQFKEHDLCEDDDTSEFDSLINDIVSRSGKILLARLFADRILEEQPMRQMRKALDSCPDSLEAAYDSTWQCIEAQVSPREALARRLLNWVTRPKRPLRIEEIIDAFALEEDWDEIDDDNRLDSKRLLSSCYGIFVEKEDSTVVLVHTTAYGFFTKVSGDIDANIDIGKTCLSYLTLRQFRSEPLSTAQELVKSLELMPFLGYAASYWGIHVQAEEAEIAVRSYIEALLRNNVARSNAFMTLQFPGSLRDDLADSVFSSIPTDQKPLHISAFWNLQNTTLRLVDDGADTSFPDSHKWTPLHWACARGSFDVAYHQ